MNDDQISEDRPASAKAEDRDVIIDASAKDADESSGGTDVSGETDSATESAEPAAEMQLTDRAAEEEGVAEADASDSASSVEGDSSDVAEAGEATTENDVAAEEDEEEASKLQWYVLKVQTNREKSIREALLKRVKRDGMEEFFGEIIVPTERVKETRGGKTRNVERRLYPGYLMVQMILNDDTWYLVRDINGVGDFTGAGGRPVPMQDHEIRQMLGQQAQKDTAPAKVKVSYSRGDVVKIKEGTFENFEGTVDEIDYETGKITVLIDILGRTTPVQDLDYWQLERV